MKMRPTLLLPLLLVLGAGCKDYVGKDIRAWKELTVKEADFKVTMPPDPSRQMQLVTAPGVGMANGNVYEASGSDWVYLVGWVDMPQAIGYDFDKGMTATAQQFDGKVLDSESIVVNGYPGVQFTMSIAKPLNGTAIERLIFVDLPSKNIKRIYTVVAAGTKVTRNDKTVRKLFDSFELTMPRGLR